MKLDVLEPLEDETKYSPSYIYRQIFGSCIKGNFQKWPNINLKLLNELNPDAIGWIHMDASPINYPIVKQRIDQPNYYLTHNFGREPSYHGAVVMNAINNGVFGAYTTIFSAHHMKDCSMFFSISRLFSFEYYKDHKCIDILMNDGMYTADFFAVQYLNSGDQEPLRTSFISNDDYVSWLDNRIKQALYNTSIVPSVNDRVVVFVTCVFPDDLNDRRDRIAAYAVLHSKKDEQSKKLPILVNAKNEIPDGYKPQLIETEGFMVDKSCYPYLRSMLLDCRLAGGYPNITSAYRSYETQQYIFNEKVSSIMDKLEIDYRLASGVVAWFCAIPGTSEHELGLAIDISAIPNCLEQSSLLTNNWLKENSWRYGFIIRYPKDKEDITGIKYEPWHYTFVGREHSEQIYKLGITLEEYIEEKKKIH